MSYGIYGGRRNTSVYLRTYRTTSTLGPLLYFDGLSAALTHGTLDTQDLLAPAPNSNSTSTPDPFADYARAKRLCAWATERGIKGFVRTNAGFELIWCNMRDERVRLVRNVDVTKWADEMDDHSDRRGSDEDGEKGPVPGGPRRPAPLPEDFDQVSSRFGPPPFPHRPGPGGPGRGPGRGGGFSMFARYASWEWLRAASHTYDGLGEARVQLHSGWYVTAHGIAPISSGGVARLAELPTESIATWKEEVDVMVQLAVEEKNESSGVDWRALTDLVVARYGDRLPQLRALLRLAFESASAHTTSILSANATVHLQHAYRLVSSIILPFYDRDASRAEQVEICALSIPPDLASKEGEADLLNPYERKLWTAIMHVHRSICTVILDVHSELVILRSSRSAPASSLEAVATRVDDLIAQLDWTVWVRCPDVCPWGEVCFVPIWPLFGFVVWNRTSWPGAPGGGRPEPQCVGSLVDPV
jgi:hypothetical protein